MDMDMSVNLNVSYSAKPAQGSAASAAVVQAKAADDAVQVKPAERQELEKAVQDIQRFATASQRNLEFSIDDSTHQVVVKVIATDTGEVVRQLPTEAALKLAQSLSDGNSLLFDANA
jgi:flagellar protein FlaG